ncbi:MAG: hypothetical protein AB1500_05490 [Bacillota bacterium]
MVPVAYTEKIPLFREAFLELINRNPVITERRGAALQRGKTWRIHIEKSGDALADTLYDKGLARPAEYPWYEVEKLTADLFMAYLASVLGKLEDLQMDPITDRAETLPIFSSSPQNVSSVRRPFSTSFACACSTGSSRHPLEESRLRNSPNSSRDTLTCFPDSGGALNHSWPTLPSSPIKTWQITKSASLKTSCRRS